HTRSKRDWSSDVCSSDLPFFTNITNTPAIGEKIIPAIKAGISLKSTCKSGGNIGNGKLIKNNINEIAPNNPMTINFIYLEDFACFDIINSPPSLLISISNFDEGLLVS